MQKKAKSLLSLGSQIRYFQTQSFLQESPLNPILSKEINEGVSSQYQQKLGQIQVPPRLLMGPGPGNAHPRVLCAQSLPLLGHLHPPMLKIMDEIQDGLRYVFQTDSKYTLLISGSGHTGMETTIASVLEPNDKILVLNNGIWGSRAAYMAELYQGQVINLEKEAGQGYSLDEIKKALEQHKPKALFVVHGESSTGVFQNLEGIGEACHANDALFCVDTVCTLGGLPFYGDKWKVDVCYSGSQKCLSAPPGSAPFFLSERAFNVIQQRKTKISSFYFDINMIGDYWGWFGKRFYHHTGVVSQFYAMREALNILSEEGLQESYQRHAAVYEQLWAGLGNLGLKPYVKDLKFRLPTVNTIAVPEGVDPVALVNNAMSKYSCEISGGLGGTAGKVWRIGIMGYNAKPQNIEIVLAAFKDGLKQQGKL